MKPAKLLYGLSLAAGIAVGAIGADLLNAQQWPGKPTVLLKTDLAGIEGKEGIILLVELPPGEAVGKHYHAAHELAYGLEGSAILEVDGSPPVDLKAGRGSYQPPNQVHNVKNASQTVPFKAVIILIAEKGQPLTVPVK